MNDKHLEELSALMDGEAAELEVRRVLVSIEKDQALCQKWARYQLASSVLKGETHGKAMNWQALDISARVAQAIDAEPAHVAQSHPKKRLGMALARPFANVAVAASVSAAVILGWQSFQGQPVATGPAALSLPTVGGAPVALTATPAGNGLMTVSEGSGQMRMSSSQGRQEIIRYNPDMDDQFNEYLISHSSNAALNTAAGMAPYARVVTLKPVKSPARLEK